MSEARCLADHYFDDFQVKDFDQRIAIRSFYIWMLQRKLVNIVAVDEYYKEEIDNAGFYVGTTGVTG